MSLRRVSLNDLARQLRLSASTVSRALTQSPEVSEATRQRVQALAREIGYQPNQLAVSLRKGGGSRTLGLLVPHVAGPFFPEVIDGVTEAASAAGYSVMICQSHDDARQQRQSLALLLGAPVAGLLVALAASTARDLAPFAEAQLPLVFFDRAADALAGPGVHAVLIDDVAGAAAAVAHLLEQGCRRIAHLAGPTGQAIYQQRLAGYRQALAERGLPYRPELVCETEPTQAAGAAAMRQLLALPEGPPDAVFAASDAAVVGALQELKRQGRRVPADVALVGFSNADFTTLTEPPLTTVDQCSRQLGREAVGQLLRLLRADSSTVAASTPVVLRPQLLVRASSQRTAA